MKIVIITPYYAPAWSYGGPPKVLSVLAEELVRKGHSVSVITTDALDNQRSTKLREKSKGVQIYRLKLFSNTLAYKVKFFYVPNLLSQAKDIIDPADLILFSDVRSILNWQLFDYVHKIGIRYGVFAFGQIPYGGGWKSLIKRIFDFLWVRRFISLATWCFAQTKHEQRMFKQYFYKKASNTQLLPLPIVIPKNNVQRILKVDFSKYGINPKDIIVLFVGRFHYLKGVDILINACIPLIRKHRWLKLVLIGRDDGVLDLLRRMIPKELKTSILFPGPIYGSELSQWYRRAKCFAFTPRYFEETSTAALEALSYGCPVVTVHESEIPFLTEYNAGVICTNRIQTIRNAIQTALHNYNSMTKNAQNLIFEHYDSKRITLQLSSFLKLT